MLDIWPGDTVTQARGLYEYLAVRPDGIQRLLDSGWIVVPNLHFSFIRRHIHGAVTNLPVRDYVAYWLDHREEIRQYQTTEFDHLFDNLLQAGLILTADKETLQADFLNANKNALNLCPGLGVRRAWQKAKAIDLDRQGKFADQVREKIDQALRAWGENNASVQSIKA